MPCINLVATSSETADKQKDVLKKRRSKLKQKLGKSRYLGEDLLKDINGVQLNNK
jgi:hypothetical protein